MSQSTIRVFHFNSTSEIAIANGSPYFNTSALLKRFEDELSPLMQVFASEQDYILCQTPPEDSFLQSLSAWGIPRAKFISMEELEQLQSESPILTVEVQAWGASPAEAFLFKNINTNKAIWEDSRTDLVGRMASVQFLSDFISTLDNHSYISPNILPQILHNEAEAEAYLVANAPAVFKSPYSSSGRGLMVLRRAELNESNRRWLQTVFKQQKYVVASPWLDKIQDLSFQFALQGGQVQFEGCTFFETNGNGQYQAHHLNFDTSQLPISKNELEQVGEKLAQQLLASPYAQHYHGKLGIDALIYAQDGKVYLHPCLEINPRYTMGAMSKRIEQFIHPSASGKYCVHTDGKQSYADKIQQLTASHPPQMDGGKLRSGVLSLTPIQQNTTFGAYLWLD